MPVSASTDVTHRSWIPQGTIPSNIERSVDTLKANPCIVMPRVILTPMAPILFFPTQTPVCSGSRSASTPRSAAVSDQHFLELPEVGR